VQLVVIDLVIVGQQMYVYPCVTGTSQKKLWEVVSNGEFLSVSHSELVEYLPDATTASRHHQKNVSCSIAEF